MDFDVVSDGQRTLIVLYALLVDIGAAPRTVLLDEPENYVGLSELQPWLQRLDEASKTPDSFSSSRTTRRSLILWHLRTPSSSSALEEVLFASRAQTSTGRAA